MFSDDAFNIVISIILGIVITFALLSIGSILIARYTKNNRLIAFCYICILCFVTC